MCDPRTTQKPPSPVVHAALVPVVRELVAPRAVVVHLAPVEHEAVRAGRLLDEQREVVHAVGLADEGVVVRDELRVGEDASEEVAIGRGPLQHAAQVRAAGHAVARERVALVAAQAEVALALDDALAPRVDGGVGPGDLVRGEDVADDDEAVEVEQVSLHVGHPRVIVRARHRDDGGCASKSR